MTMFPRRSPSEPAPVTPRNREPLPAFPPGAPRTWSEAVVWCKALADRDTRRQVALRRIDPLWREFTQAWAMHAEALKSVEDCQMPREYLTFTERLSWAWEQVDEFVPSVLMVLDNHTSLSTGEIAHVFRVMQGAGLIFPDGSVQSIILTRLDQEASAADANLSARQARDMYRAAKFGKGFQDIVSPRGNR